MPKSSRHKSSKHSSREYSDSEKDSGLKERKSKEESVSHRASREYASGEKRKYESKPVGGKDSGIVDFVDDYGTSSSKKRKEKVDDDRWTGGDTDERESAKADKDLKGLSDSKSRSRRGNESSGRAVDVDEGKKSAGKGDSKHHRSERKERSDKDGVLERDKKGKEHSTSDRFVDGEVDIIGGEGSRKKAAPLEDVAEKHLSNHSGVVSHSVDEKRNSEHDKENERRFRRKDSSNDVDKYVDGKEVEDRRVSSRNETVKSVKYKDDGHEDDRYKDKYGDEVEKDSRFQDEKQHHRDGRHARDHASSRSDEKYVKNEKKDVDVALKKSKTQDNDREHGRSRHSRHHDERDRDRDRDDRNRDIDLDRDGDHDGGRDRDRDRGRDVDRDRDRDRDRERYHRDYASHVDERSSRFKEDRGRKRSPDDYDDYYSDKAKTVKPDLPADREKSVSRRTHSEAVAGSTRGRTSPSYRSHVDKYRDNTQDDARHGDSRQLLATPDKSSSKYPSSSDRNPKSDDNHQRVREQSAERSPRKKTSPPPRVMQDKSPSSTSVDRKYPNRGSDRRQSHDVDEAERRSSGSNNIRDGSSINDDRQSKDISPKKSLGEENSPVESSFNRKSSNQGNGSFVGHGGSSSYKAGADSPLIGSMGEDSRSSHNNNNNNNNSRYRRSVDPNLGRAGHPSNMWKGVPNWPTPMQSGFMPFPPGPHGPPHAVFPSVLPQYPSPIFGVRPPMDMNHSGMPYLPDADRFMRPLGWQNMLDGSSTPSHFPSWGDANNAMYRDDPSMYGSGSIPNGRVRDTNLDIWKPNGDVKLETATKKDDFTDEAHVTQDAQGGPPTGNDQNEEQGTVKTSMHEVLGAITNIAAEKVPESPPPADDDDAPKSLRAYLSCLDISVELTNPDLYNELVSLAVIDQTENLDDKEDLDMGITIVGDSEITNVTRDISLFPAPEDSIFQRALDLYKTHNPDRRFFHILDEVVSKSPPIPRDNMDVTEQEQGGGEEVTEQEGDDEPEPEPEPEPVHNQETPSQPVEESSSSTTSALAEPMEATVDPMESVTVDLPPSSEVAVKEENTSPKLISGDAEMKVAEDEKEEMNVEQQQQQQQLDSEVTEPPLNLGHGSVKVCQGMMPVSNECESESVTITPVLDAPESTH